MSTVDTLRFTTAGSVDDGKSTLIGRLLYDTKSIFEDQLAAIESTTAKRGAVDHPNGVDLSLLTDGLTAEREQGITIDVAYRYFTGPKRRFIIADTPGHEQYTRNMVTGASTADLSIILVDASKGLQTQSRRHAILAALLGIPHVVVAVNKMDLCEYSQVIFEAIRRDFLAFAAPLGIARLDFIPVSALKGDMVVERGHALHWHDGPTLLELLETTDAPHRRVGAFRFPVQRVAATKFPGAGGAEPRGIELRGYQGRIESGRVRVGDRITILPAGHEATVSDIVTLDGRLDEAGAPLSVTLLLDRQIDISRGDTFTHRDDAPQVSNRIVADLCWFGDAPLDRGRRYLLKHGTQSVRVAIDGIEHKLDVNTLKREAAITLRLNDIGRLRLKTLRPLAVDRYADNRASGSFILIDEVSNATVAGGLIAGVTNG
ncbi:MAG: 50S ribosome-binding GTPase [Betaproteobacteria bacterium]|nr:50S ribosome-binding GTPase [Betaproteobacteria bacterium]